MGSDLSLGFGILVRVSYPFCMQSVQWRGTALTYRCGDQNDALIWCDKPCMIFHHRRFCHLSVQGLGIILNFALVFEFLIRILVFFPCGGGAADMSKMYFQAYIVLIVCFIFRPNIVAMVIGLHFKTNTICTTVYYVIEICCIYICVVPTKV